LSRAANDFDGSKDGPIRKRSVHDLPLLMKNERKEERKRRKKTKTKR
jgi:hypothetical protein